MSELTWLHPITVEGRKTGERIKISSVERAADYMSDEWPTVEDGAAFNMARDAMLKAKDGRVGAEDARAAFLSALEEGHIAVFAD